MSVFMETCDFEAFVQQWAFASGEEVSHSSLVRGSISRRNYFIDQPLAKYLCTRPSKCRLRLFVPTRNYANGVHDDDCIERAIPVEGSEGLAYLAAGARRTFLTRPTRNRSLMLLTVATVGPVSSARCFVHFSAYSHTLTSRCYMTEARLNIILWRSGGKHDERTVPIAVPVYRAL